MSHVIDYHKYLMTPFGEAECDLAYISDTGDVPVEYQCWLFETGEPWWFSQSLVRAIPRPNEPYRKGPSDIHLSDTLLAKYAHHILRHKKSPFYERAKALTRA